MPVLPGPDSLGPLPSGRSGAGIASFDTSSVGRAVAGLGQAMEQGAAQLQQSWERNAALDGEVNYQKFHMGELQTYNDAVSKVRPEEAAGFTQSYLQGYKERAKQFLDTLPQQLRTPYTAKLMQAQQGFYSDAHRFETEQQKTAAENATNDVVNTSFLPRADLAAKIDDPAKAEATLGQTISEANAVIDQNPNYTAAQKEEKKRKVTAELQFRYNQALPPGRRQLLDPAWSGSPAGAGGSMEARGAALPSSVGSAIDQAATAHGVDPSVMRTIAAIESGGNSKAVTGNNRGLFQLSPDIFSRYGKGGDIYDPAANADAAAAELAAFQKKFVAENGRLPGAGEVYLYHQQGEAGAPALLKNPGSVAWQAVRKFYPSDAVAKSAIWGNIADPDKARFGSVDNITAAEFTTYWKQKVEGGTSAPVIVGGKAIMPTAAPVASPSPHTYDALTFDDRMKLADSGRKEVDQATAQQEKDQAAAIIQRKGTFDLAIETGDLTDPSIIRDDPFLKDADKAALLRSWETKNKDVLDMRAAVERLTSGDHFNPFDSKDGKAVDLAFDAVIGHDGFKVDDQQSVARLRGAVGATDIVPKSAVETIRAGIYSRDQSTRDAAFAVMDGLMRENPPAAARAFNDADTKRLMDYQALAPFLSPEDLNKRLDPMRDPRETKIDEQLRDEGRKLADKIQLPSILESAFGHGFADALPGVYQPENPFGAGQGAAFQSDFATLFAERYASTRDANAAQSQAIQLLKRKWDPSSVTGTATVMAWPPEHAYPKVNGSWDWMADQLKAEVDARFPGSTKTNVVATAKTEAGGEAPPYQVIVEDKDGVLHTFAAKWDSAAAIAKARQDFQQQRDKAASSGLFDRLTTPSFKQFKGEPPAVTLPRTMNPPLDPMRRDPRSLAPPAAPAGVPQIGGPGTVLPPAQNPMRRDPRAGGFPVRR